MKRNIQEKKILKSLSDISRFINFVENPGLVLSLIIEECVLLTGAEWGAIISLDKALNPSEFQVAKPAGEAEKKKAAELLNSVVAKAVEKYGLKAALTNRLWSRDAIKKGLAGALEGLTDGEINSILVCPAKKGGSFLGLAVVVNKRGRKKFLQSDQGNLNAICQGAAIVIENLELFKAKLHAEKMAAVGETITGIAHYIKNVLQGILSGSTAIKAALEDKNVKMIQMSWDIIDNNIGVISSLVLDMLYYSGKRELQKEKFQLKGTLKSIINLCEPAMREKGIRLVTESMELPEFIMADKKGIHRSLLNMITNAADACDKPDAYVEVKSSYSASNGLLKIIVSDNGKGMSKEDQKRIFQPFFTKKKKEGTGMGLAITSKIIAEHGGSIRVESEPGKGTLFEISLPCV